MLVRKYEDSGEAFFASQSYCAVAWENGTVYGLYILHPNNVGRCGHICNASYAVRKDCRGMHIGQQLVEDCLETQKKAALRAGNLLKESGGCQPRPAIEEMDRDFIKRNLSPGGSADLLAASWMLHFLKTS